MGHLDLHSDLSTIKQAIDWQPGRMTAAIAGWLSIGNLFHDQPLLKYDWVSYHVR